jgi:hypothetical protein
MKTILAALAKFLAFCLAGKIKCLFEDVTEHQRQCYSLAR